ncbi:hypothetical protein CHS0354_012219 [Potamilus streckersoni]|uniref:SH3 domain-binding protein 5-like n=1 Tax=Potamilus streckersoni TaxID=2493646 RepID=A0AAE0SA24_9BIVA|nr:hypothetical protein CHS0354_012219 [Potamilus streckersoni]
METTNEEYCIPQPDGDLDEEDDILDNRIQVELDKLNQASAEINKLENELDEARTKYRCTLTETSHKMAAAAKGRRKRIDKAREYYKLKGELKNAQGEALKAARQYQTATGIYNAAKETVTLAEVRLMEKMDNCSSTTAQLSSAWQEMLNHTIQRVMDAEKEKSRSEMEHKRTSAQCQELTEKVQGLKKKFKKSIAEARPYFELTSELEIKLQQQKQNINDLQAAIKANKERYKETLRRLEEISEEIHLSRKNKLWKYIQRTPGVGAEVDSVSSSLSDLRLELPCSRASFSSQDFSNPDDEMGDKMDDVFRDKEIDGTDENAELQSVSELECDAGSTSESESESFETEEHASIDVRSQEHVSRDVRFQEHASIDVRSQEHVSRDVRFQEHVSRDVRSQEHVSRDVRSHDLYTSLAERNERDSLRKNTVTSKHGEITVQNGSEDLTVTQFGCNRESTNSNSDRTSELVFTDKSKSEEYSSMEIPNQNLGTGSKLPCIVTEPS